MRQILSLLLPVLLLPIGTGCQVAGKELEHATQYPLGVIEPRRDQWVTYEGFFAIDETAPSTRREDLIIVDHGHGAYRPVSVRLRAPSGMEGIEAEVRMPRFRSEALHNRGSQEGSRRELSLHERLGEEHERLLAALDHHRPPVRLRILPNGEASIVDDEALRRHEACARRLLERSFERLIATSETEELSTRWRVRRDNAGDADETPPQAALLLLRTLALHLPPANETSPFEAQRRISEDEVRRSGRPTPRFEQMRLHGQQAALEIDLFRDASSPAAQLCRAIEVEAVDNMVRHRCRIEAVFDTRDGWPIALNIRREIEGPPPRKASRTAFFRRLQPREEATVPADPCSVPAD